MSADLRAIASYLITLVIFYALAKIEDFFQTRKNSDLIFTFSALRSFSEGGSLSLSLSLNFHLSPSAKHHIIISSYLFLKLLYRYILAFPDILLPLEVSY